MRTDFTLRAWRLADKVSLVENANNINIWNNVRDYFPYPYTENDGEQFIQMVMNKSKPETDLAIDINGKAVGGIGIVLNSDVERVSVELGYWIGEKYWNKGIMTEAVKRMVKYVFSQFPVVKIYAPVFDFNVASMKVLENSGFSCEGILKQAAIKNGKIINLHYYGLTKCEE